MIIERVVFSYSFEPDKEADGLMQIMLKTLFGSFLTIYSSIDIFFRIYCCRNTIKIRTILRICSQYVSNHERFGLKERTINSY